MRACLAILLATTLVLGACDGGDDETTRDGATGTDTRQRSPAEVRISTVATGLEAPWEIVFLPDGRALVTERAGRVRLFSRDGGLRDEPAAEVEVQAVGEAGLLGLAIDPEFEANRFVYLYRTTADDNEVVRYRMRGDRLEEDAVVIDGIPAGAIHDGGRIHFGPDGRLYVTAGEAGSPELAQDQGSLGGKFLTLGPAEYRGSGGRPAIHTSGHRNPQGFDWEPGTDRLLATEHGQSANDEINVIRRGRNYGWPEAEGPDHGSFTAPIHVYEGETLAPSGATFVSREGSAWTGDLLVAGLVGEQLRRLRLDGDDVVADEVVIDGDYGRLRTVVEGPDGALYVLTSNRDGRGDPTDEDDRILRIVPPRG